MDAPVSIGDVVADKYLVERILGKGGMGVVYVAKHLHLGERVALKFLRAKSLKEPEIVARFLREGRTAARLRSEYTARVRDVGTLPDGVPYLVMEYLDGRDFDAVLAEHGALDPEVAVKYLLQACEALAEAHSMGIVHRDLKPANLILIRKPDGKTAIKIIDFGISKLMSGEDGIAVTQVAVMMGSPLYMAPEQMASARDADARSDVFSLGSIFFHLLTGKPPFQGTSAVDVFDRISHGPPSPRALRPGLPADIEEITSRCLQKDPAHRYGDVALLAAALAPFGPPHAALFAESAERILRGVAPTGETSSSIAPSGMGPASTPMRSSRPLPPAPPPPPPPAPRSPLPSAPEPVKTALDRPLSSRSGAVDKQEPKDLLDELFELGKASPRGGAGEPPPRSRPLSTPPPSTAPAPLSLPALPAAPLSTPPLASPRSTPPPFSPRPVVELPDAPPPPMGSPLAKVGRDVEGEVLEAVREALAGFGLAGTVTLEGRLLTIRGNGLPTSIDAGPAAEQWPLLPVDMQRRKAQDLVRRLAEGHRIAQQRARSGPGGGGDSGIPWLVVGKALLGIAAAAGLVLGVRAYLASRKEAEVPAALPSETPEQQSRRLATACRAVRERIYSGATIGPFDTTGWVVELWVASREGGMPGAAADAGAPPSKPISRASMASLVSAGRLAPGLDDTLSSLPDGTLVLDEAVIPKASPGWTGVTLRFGGGYARAFFEPATRARFLALGDRLFEATSADVGALYARCAESPVHDVGAWFRGRDAGGAATALIWGVGMFAERPQVSAARIGPAEIDGLRAAAGTAKLDAPTLKSLVGEHGGSLVSTPGGVTLAFPLGGPVRAVGASRAVATRIGVARE